MLVRKNAKTKRWLNFTIELSLGLCLQLFLFLESIENLLVVSWKLMIVERQQGSLRIDAYTSQGYTIHIKEETMSSLIHLSNH